MSLEKQKVAIPITDGIDTKGDDKVELPTRFTALENVVFTKPTTVRKRYGLNSVSTVTTGGSSLSSGSALSELNNSLVVMNGTNLYSRTAGTGLLSDRGDLAVGIPNEVTVYASKLAGATALSAIYTNCYVHDSGIAVVTFVKSSQDCPVIVYDVNSKTKIAEFNLFQSGVTAAGPSPAYVTFLNGKFVILWCRSDGTFINSGLDYYTITLSNPTTLSSPVNIKTRNSSALLFWYYTLSDKIIIYTNYSTGGNVRVIESNFSISSPSGTSIIPASVSVASLAKFDNSTLALVYRDPSFPADVVLFLINTTTYAITATNSISTPAVMSGLAACYNPAGGILIISHSAAGSTDNVTINVSNLTYNGTTVSITNNYFPTQYGVFPVSKPFYIGTSPYIFARSSFTPSYTNFYNITGSASPINTLYLFKLTTSKWVPVASFARDNLYAPPFTFGNDMDVYQSRNTMYLSYMQLAEPNPARETNIIAPVNITLMSLDFTTNSNFIDTKMADSLHISGGVLQQFDGSAVTEHGFLQTPPAPIVTHVTGGGDLSTGTYQYCYCLSWTDSTGRVHRSSPSAATSISASNNDSNTIKIASVPITSKTNYTYELYRTTANGSIFYKIYSFIFDNNYVAGYTISDNTALNKPDAAIIYLEPLYTNGGILENDAAYPCTYVTNYRNRIFTIMSDGYNLQYSKSVGSNQAVEFSSSFTIELDAKGGPATALSSLNDSLVIFKETAIFAMNGEGPNDAGENDDYRTPYLITTDCGCIDKNSVVEIPEGLVFKSKKGIYMLKRNFALQYIGDSVEAYNSLTVTSSTMLARYNQARFILSNGIALVYDYYVNRWSTFTNYAAVDSIDVNGYYYLLDSSGDLRIESEGNYTDNGSLIPLKIKTAWFQFGGVQGFQRIYQVLLMGTHYNNFNLNVSIWSDFDDTSAQTVSIATGAPATSGLLQYRIFTKKQKCQSLMIQITDAVNGTPDQSFDLSHLELEVGVKKGTNKVSASNSKGVS